MFVQVDIYIKYNPLKLSGKSKIYITNERNKKMKYILEGEKKDW